MSDLGLYIREQRTSKKMSIRKLAEEAGISHTEIKRIEDGLRRQTSPQVLRSISGALNVPYEELMEVAGYIDNNTHSTGGIVVPAGIMGADDLTEDELTEVNQFIEFLKNKRKK